jgi:neutral ceramidase
MSGLTAGFARATITPPLHSPAIYGVTTFVDEIWDPLLVTALFLGQGDEQAVLVGLDVCGILGNTYQEMSEAVASKLGISSGQVWINASHTHSGPYLSTDLQQLLDPYGLCAVDVNYLKLVQATVAKLAAEAMEHAVPVSAWVGSASVDRVASNRRVELEDGRTIHRHGRPPKSYRRLPEGLIDPDVMTVRFEDSDRRPVGALINYACHPTAAGGDLHGWVSADFVGHGRQLVETTLGAPCLFLQGTAGDIGTGKWISSTPLGDVAAMGKRFAAGAVRALGEAQPTDGTNLRVERIHVELALEPFPHLGELERRLEMAVPSGDAGTIVAAGDALAAARRADQLRRAPIGAVAIGDLAVSLLPAEVFVAIGLRIKESSPFPHTLVSAYNDNSLQYVPTADAFAAGEYEIDGGWRYVAPGDGDRLARGALDALSDVRRK